MGVESVSRAAIIMVKKTVGTNIISISQVSKS